MQWQVGDTNNGIYFTGTKSEAEKVYQIALEKEIQESLGTANGRTLQQLEDAAREFVYMVPDWTTA